MLLSEGRKGDRSFADRLEHRETPLTESDGENKVVKPGVFFCDMLNGEGTLDENGEGRNLVQ